MMKQGRDSFLTFIVLGSLMFLVAASAAGQVFTNLHSFAFSDGAYPAATMVQMSNRLYGTTGQYGGGTGGGSGSVFAISLDGSGFTNLHTFIQDSNGGSPNGLLISSNTLYGTAVFGGASNAGCIFAINIDGTGLTNLFSFAPLSSNVPYTNVSGAYPQCGLAWQSGRIYGSAAYGGSFGVGTVFVLSPNGSSFTNLHQFSQSDGEYPGTLTVSGATLYGTAFGGGTYGYGCVFRMNTDGSGFTNLHSFTPTGIPDQTNADGAFPAGTLLSCGGTLYGTTSGGGAGGNGTVFAIGTNGAGYTVLHNFSATNGAIGINSDGAVPQSGLTILNDTLYGTAQYGGADAAGTVYSVKTNGSGFMTLHSFTATDANTGTNSDGANPVGGLVLAGTTLYGTANAGGDSGYGAIFAITIEPALSIAMAGTNAIVSWPTNFAGFSLQTATNFAPAVWSAVPGSYSVTNPIARIPMFFRLSHP